MLALSLTLTLTLKLALALTCVIEKSRMTPRYMKMVTPSAVFVKSPLARISPTMLMADAGDRLVRMAPIRREIAQRRLLSVESASITRHFSSCSLLSASVSVPETTQLARARPRLLRAVSEASRNCRTTEHRT